MGCDAANDNMKQANSGLKVVDGAPVAAGDVGVTGQSATGYTIESMSKSTNKFKIVKSAGTVTRTCTTAGNGACPSGGNW